VDADTDDGTPELARREGAEVRLHSTGGKLDDVGFVAFAQNRYPEARGNAEWVAWVDADEFLYHPRLSERLDELRAQGVTYPRVSGYQMVADAPPDGPGQLTEHVRRGLPAKEYGKPCIFDPALDVRWTPGKHDASVTGAATRDDGSDPLKLLHYRWFGERWLRERNARNFARIDAANRAVRHGQEVYPDWTGTYSAQWFREHAPEATEVVG
jgi:glycosyltransferase involved in cell wall biosynthesis